jgi:hypothetical protein
MKLYIVTDKEGKIVDWAGKQADAKWSQKESDAMAGFVPKKRTDKLHTWHELEFSTKKEDVIEFLQQNCTGKALILP